MRVEQNDFRDMFSGYLSVTAQAQHVLCIPGGPVAHTGLAGEEWLKAFPLQTFQYGDGGDVRIVLASGRVFIFPKIPGTWCISSSCVSGRSRRIWFAA